MSRPSLAPLALGALAAASLLAPGIRVPATRGGARLVDGFRPGRWDAHVLVGRGPAAVTAPGEPVRVALSLSGPARMVVRTRDGALPWSLGGSPSTVTFDLKRGERAELEAQGTVRLHDARVERAGPTPWRRVAAVALASFAGAALVLRFASRWIAPVSVLLVAVAATASLHGTLGALVLAVAADRLAPTVVLALLAASFVAAVRLPRKGLAAPAPPSALPVLFGGITLASCLTQVLLGPQPLLIGDPAAYHDIGGRFLEALGAVRTPDDLADAVQTLRPYGGLVFTGLLYAAFRGVRDDLSTIYVLQALAMAVAIGFLVRAAFRLGGRRVALLTGVFAVLYPTFPLICGIVQPEPLILLLWTLSLDRLLAACETSDPRSGALAGVAFALGLALHPQGIWFLLVALVLLLLPLARALSRPPARAAGLAFALGVAPVVLTVGVAEAYARPTRHVLEERHGFWAYTARVPLGFWLFIDTDGWQGPLRIDDTRYARGLIQAQERGDVAGLLGSLGYTTRFVAANLGASVGTVLRNVHRLFEVPDNPFRRDFILPYSLQLRWHRALYALFLLSTPLTLARRGASVLAPFLLLSATYPLYHVFDKYGVPATPSLLLGAALATDAWIARPSRTLALALGAAAVGALLGPADLVLRGVAPAPLARTGLEALRVVGLTGAFLVVARLWARSGFARAATALAAALLIVPSLAAAIHDPAWRDFSVVLDREVRHEIAAGADGLARLASAREGYLLLDLRLPNGDPKDLRLAFDTGLVVAGRELQPTMPSFGLATIRGGLDPRTFRQWWRTGWRAEMGHEGRMGLTLRGGGHERLFGALATPDPDGVDDGLSLGQWPHASVYRLMHDGEYRLPTRQTLSGVWRESRYDGRRLPGLFGVRLVILDDDSGGALWETAPAPAPYVATAVWARAGRAARADLVLPSGSLRMDFERSGPWTGPAGEVRLFPTGQHEGWYCIKTRATPGRPLALAVRPLQEMSAVPKYFFPELRVDRPPLPLDWAGLPYVPPARILEAREAPPWRPAVVY